MTSFPVPIATLEPCRSRSKRGSKPEFGIGICTSVEPAGNPFVIYRVPNNTLSVAGFVRFAVTYTTSATGPYLVSRRRRSGGHVSALRAIGKICAVKLRVAHWIDAASTAVGAGVQQSRYSYMTQARSRRRVAAGQDSRRRSLS